MENIIMEKTYFEYVKDFAVAAFELVKATFNLAVKGFKAAKAKFFPAKTV
jgi:hypothetical protein